MLKKLIEEHVKDPRSDRKKPFSLYDILGLALLSALAGEVCYTDMQDFGDLHAEELSLYFGIQRIPSHDTIRLLFERVDPEHFMKLFDAFLGLLRESLGAQRDVIALDGKTIRNSGKDLLHVVSAWSVQNRLILAHQKSDGKGTEIKALNDILEGLDIEGHIVTTDALGCQKSFTENIISRGGDYVLQVKRNQKNLLETMEPYLNDLEVSCQRTSWDKKRGWVHKITTTVCQDIDYLHETVPGWTGIRSIIKVTKTLAKKEKTCHENRFYISSFDAHPLEIQEIITQHWGVENNVHWVLDVRFKEDHACIRSSNGAENMNLLKKIGTNLLHTIQKEFPKKMSLKALQRRFRKPSLAAGLLKNCLKFIHS